MIDSCRQAGAPKGPTEGFLSNSEIGTHGGRGVYVPAGMTAAEIMELAELLDSQFGIEPYTSRQIARAILTFYSRPRPSKLFI